MKLVSINGVERVEVVDNNQLELTFPGDNFETESGTLMEVTMDESNTFTVTFEVPE